MVHGMNYADFLHHWYWDPRTDASADTFYRTAHNVPVRPPRQARDRILHAEHNSQYNSLVTDKQRALLKASQQAVLNRGHSTAKYG